MAAVMTPRAVVIAVAGALAVALVGSVVGVIVLAAMGSTIPGILENIAVGALGAVAGLLARTGTDPPPAAGP